MKKSNWIIIGVLVAASIFFLWLWYYLQFNLVDDPLDLMITIVWWELIIIVCICIHYAEVRRQRRIRTTFVGKSSLYNGQLGLVELVQGETPVAALQHLLSSLKYNFDIQDLPDDRRDRRFIYAVYSKKYKDDGNVWQGEVVTVADPDREPMKFYNRDELSAILQA